MNGNMRQAVDEFPWAAFLNGVFRRDANLGHSRQVRVMVDANKEDGFCLRHPCVGFDWAPDPDAPVPTALVTFTHIEVWRRSRWTSHDDAGAAGGELGGRHRPCFPQPARSRSRSFPRGVCFTWPTRVSSPAAVALLRSARVREVRLPAPRLTALAAVANAWVEQITSQRRAVERVDGLGVESALSIIGKTTARVVDGEANFQRFSQHLEAVQPEAETEPTRFNAQSILGRRVHAGGGPSRAPPTARNPRVRNVSQDSRTSDGWRRGDEEEG